jgi:5-methylcytosine-specific restriction endonuclease McrA
MGKWTGEAAQKWQRDYLRRLRQDPAWVEAERARDRARYRTSNRVFHKPPETAVAITHNQRAKKYGVPGRLTAADIRALWERQPTCVTCGVGRGVDHIRAMSRGGANVPDNLQTMCGPCNSRKWWREDRQVVA